MAPTFFHVSLDVGLDVYVLLSFIVMMYLPCVVLAKLDSRDWLPPERNQSAYFLARRTTRDQRPAWLERMLGHTVLKGDTVEVSASLAQDTWRGNSLATSWRTSRGTHNDKCWCATWGSVDSHRGWGGGWRTMMPMVLAVFA